MPYSDPVKQRQAIKKAWAKWRLKNPDWEKSYLSRRDVKDRRALNARKRRALNPGKESEISRRWRQAHKAHIRDLNRAYRARSWRAQGVSTPEQIQARINYFGGKCIYCKIRDYECIDHMIPLSRGGTNWPSNLAPACLRCNSSKRNRTPSEYKLYITLRDKTCLTNLKDSR